MKRWVPFILVAIALAAFVVLFVRHVWAQPDLRAEIDRHVVVPCVRQALRTLGSVPPDRPIPAEIIVTIHRGIGTGQVYRRLERRVRGQPRPVRLKVYAAMVPTCVAAVVQGYRQY